MDLWGNVKIPYLPKLNDLNSDRWIQILDPAPEYSSLLGIPLGSMESGNTTLSLESTYIGLDCSNPTNGPEVSLLYDPEVPLSNGTFWSVNITACGGLPLAWIVATDIWLPSDSFPEHFANAKNLEVDQSRLLFESGRGGPWDNPDMVSANSSDGFTVVYCNLSQIYVESNVTCNKKTVGAQNCTVTAQHPSQLPHASPNLTTLSSTVQFVDMFQIGSKPQVSTTRVRVTCPLLPNTTFRTHRLHSFLETLDRTRNRYPWAMFLLQTLVSAWGSFSTHIFSVARFSTLTLGAKA